MHETFVNDVRKCDFFSHPYAENDERKRRNFLLLMYFNSFENNPIKGGYGASSAENKASFSKGSFFVFSDWIQFAETFFYTDYILW